MGRIILVCYNIIIGMLLQQFLNALKGKKEKRFLDKKEITTREVVTRILLGFSIVFAILCYIFHIVFIATEDYKLAMCMNILVSAFLYVAIQFIKDNSEVS